MKKLISLLLALVFVVSLTACGAADTGKEDATKTVENFMSAVVELDAEKVGKYLDDESAIPDDFKDFDLDTLMADLPTEFDAYSEDFEAVMSDFVDKVTSTIKYDIQDVEEEDDDEYVFTLEVTVPSDDTDMDSVLEDQLSDEALNDALMDLFYSGEITESSTEEDIYALLMPTIIDMIEEALENIEIETETKEVELVVTKEDDEWLINADKSDIDEIL